MSTHVSQAQSCDVDFMVGQHSFFHKKRLNTHFSTKQRLKGYLQTIEEGVKVFKDSIHHCNGDDGERPAHADEYDLYPQSFHMDAENTKHDLYPQAFHMDAESTKYDL